MNHKITFALITVAALVPVTVGCNGDEPAPRPTINTPAEELPTVEEEVPPERQRAGLVTEGIYLVGEDIPAGTYKTTGPATDEMFDSCYFERSKDDSGDLMSIIDNNNIQGPGRFTVENGQVLTLSGTCVWEKSG